jgi:hypothetical protein
VGAAGSCSWCRSGFGDELGAAVDELDQRRLRVVLAHPERAAGFAESVLLLHEQVARRAAVGHGRSSAGGRPHTLEHGMRLATAGDATEAEATQLVDNGPRSLAGRRNGWPEPG